MARVIIFGIKDLAELAHFYLETDSNHEVVAFSVNRNYLPGKMIFKGLPVVAFEEIEKDYKPGDFSFFAPMTHKDMNKERERIYNEIKGKGYGFINYISSRATTFNNLVLGDNCFILEDNTIQPFVTIGSNVILWSGNHIGHHSTISDHVFITSQVVISGNCIIGSNCFIGVNSGLKENTTIGGSTFIAMGSSITQNTEPFGVYSGNPARRLNMSSLDLRF
jgi:sugar O-acyltransferase (sialic acid O-acetyltransferase NeuD family)